jgi:hypothetical protein
MNPVEGQTKRLQYVGANADDQLDSALASLRELVGPVSNGAQLLQRLDEVIEGDLTSLRSLLQGYDSFDTLAFLRLNCGPWDFSEVRESESTVESSQSAQDVVALTLLSMGLPRQPLTGINTGQPSPMEAMRLASRVVSAARTRALLLGRRVDQPLGDLSGAFLGYELSVRGRQYVSIAQELNTQLLGNPNVHTVMQAMFGFGLEDVRAARDAGSGLLNERFFGARDRIGDAALKGEQPDVSEADGLRRDLNLMVNECRLFGAVTAEDVADRSGLDLPVVRGVLDFFSQGRPNDVEDPVRSFVSGRLPAPWGCIADSDGYLILNGFLGEDELRRDVERGLLTAVANKQPNAGKAWDRYEKRRTTFAESITSTAMNALLAGATPAWRNQRYLGPGGGVDVGAFAAAADTAEMRGDVFESDLLYVLDGVALCIEVKAGSVTEKARGGNAQRLATDLQKTLKDGNEQSHRLAELLRQHGGVWSDKRVWIDVGPLSEIHSIIVMLDDMGPLSLAMNELASQGIIETDQVPWIVSVHDLLVISRTLEHPAQFLEFLRRRRARRLATMVKGVDELDMFMWFLGGGMYFEPDPEEVATQLPVTRAPKSSDVRRFKDQPEVRLGTLTDPLDAWFYSCDGLSRVEAPKPRRVEAAWVEQYLSESEASSTPGWLRFGADLVGLSGAAQDSLGKALRQQTRRAVGGDVERTVTTHGTTSVGSWLLTLAAVPAGVSTAHLLDYLQAKQYQTESSRAMLLLYDTSGRITGSLFEGAPQARSAARDAEIASAPLQSLATTFSTQPPSARRAKRQLRGKRAKKKRR